MGGGQVKNIGVGGGQGRTNLFAGCTVIGDGNIKNRMKGILFFTNRIERYTFTKTLK